MPGKRTTMRKLRDVLRLRHAAGLSIRDISRSTKLSVGGIQKLLSRAQALHLSWPLPAALDDTRLAQLFYPGADTGSSRRYQVPDWPAVHQELKRPHVTKRLLWKNIPNATRTGVTATPSSVTVTGTGAANSGAPCGNPTRPVRSALWITAGPLCR